MNTKLKYFILIQSTSSKPDDRHPRVLFSQEMRSFDFLIYVVAFLIALLLATGGAHYSTPTLKLEVSQVDAFAWALLILLGIRRLRWKRWFPQKLERTFNLFLAIGGRYPLSTIGLATFAYVVSMTWNSAWRFDSFHTNAFDLSFVDQALWSTTRVGLLHSSLSKGQTYLGEHFSPILAVVALLYRLCDSVYALFLFQSLVLSAGAWLVYALAMQKKLPRQIAIVVAICFLAYQPLRAANSFDFREDNLFVPIFLGALLAVERRQWAVVWALALLSWCTKENAPIFTALMGAWLAIGSLLGKAPRSQRIHGAVLCLLSLCAFLVINMKVTPHFVGAGTGAQTMLVKRMHQFGNSNEEILKFILINPFAFAREVTRPLLQPKAVKYFLDVTLPFLYFVPAAPLVALIVFAGISMNLLVNVPTIGFHYECILIPFLFYILISGLADLYEKNRLSGIKIPALVLLSFLLLFGRSPIEAIRRNAPNERHRMVAEELRKIPAGASVATQSVLHPHLTHRKDVFLFSAGVPSTDYIVADLSPGVDRYATPNLDADVKKIDPATYELALDRDQLKIWRRK